MTDQELFDRVARHLLTQAEQSWGNGECRYRGENGLKCAIGCLIPDDKYHSELEGNPSCSPDVLKAAGILESQESLAEELQVIHDNYVASEWPKRIRATANALGLSCNAVDELEPTFREKLAS